MNTNQMKNHIANGGIDAVLTHVYGEAALEAQKARYSAAIDEFAAIYGADKDITLYSVAGRSELSGNHTDHNHGCVVAASIDLDIIAVASKRDDSVIRIKSEGFPEDVIDFSTYTAPVEDQFGTSGSIIAGMCAGFLKDGYKIGGFDAYTTSNVLKGSGLSSSAAFEDMVGNILNHMYNDGKVDNVEIAKLAQYSENVFFGTGGNHADLTDDYASVPAEMKAVAAHFGKAVLREVDEAGFVAEIPVLREKVGDRAVLRALHFFAENKRVAKQKVALLGGDLDAFFAEVLASGKSSFCYLQNVYTSKNLSEQGLSLALCLAEQYLASKSGAWRVHGGGFAGTIQAYVSMDEVDGFKALMDSVFGEGKCIVLRIRPEGAVKIA